MGELKRFRVLVMVAVEVEADGEFSARRVAYEKVEDTCEPAGIETLYTMNLGARLEQWSEMADARLEGREAR